MPGAISRHGLLGLAAAPLLAVKPEPIIDTHLEVGRSIPGLLSHRPEHPEIIRVHALDFYTAEDRDLILGKKVLRIWKFPER